MKTAKPIKILLAEDHTIVREGLRKLMDAEPDLEVVAEAENGRQAVALTMQLLPAVVVMDIAMPLLNGLEATRQILKIIPDAKVLILSAHSDEPYVEQVMKLGAMGYLVKQSSARYLIEAIREVNRGKLYFSPAIAERLKRHYQKSPGGSELCLKPEDRLSSREAEVLQLIAEGLANKQVAAELDISVKTVEKHRQRVMQKLNLHDTASLTRHAIAAGIVETSASLRIDPHPRG